jgi:pilus assembly protein CpaE
MHGIAIALLTEDKEMLAFFQHRLEATEMTRTVFTHVGFPVAATDPVLRQIQDVRSDIIIVDIDPAHIQPATRAIELINSTTSEVPIFAFGEMVNPLSIVAAMRAGAREYIERNASTEQVVEALSRFTSQRNKARSSGGRARVIMVTNAKGGAGATTIAVNTAIALQEASGSVLLVDFASLGHTALHLNVRPSFGITDALQNLHRMDFSLLEGLITPCKGGLQLLAGSPIPNPISPSPSELARLFDLLVANFRFVVVDCSGRLDQTSRLLADLSNTVLLVAQADVVSLWSAGRIRNFLDEGSGRERVRLVMNRYKKIPGFSDEDLEKAASCKLLTKMPNNYQSAAPAIDKGTPVAFQENDLARAFRSLASLIAHAPSTSDGSVDYSAQVDRADARKKPAGRLLISPLRAGQ